MMDGVPRRGLYLLTPDEADTGRLLARVVLHAHVVHQNVVPHGPA